MTWIPTLGCTCSKCESANAGRVHMDVSAAKDARIAALESLLRQATERAEKAEQESEARRKASVELGEACQRAWQRVKKAEAEVARLSGLIAEVIAMIDGALNVPKGEVKN